MREEYGTLLESGAMRFVRDLPGPIERVWSYLVDPDKRGTWFCGGTMGERAGDGFTLRFDHRNITDEPVPDRFAEMRKPIEMSATVVAIDPPRLLVFRWNEDGVETRIELEEAGERVRMVLLQPPPPSVAEQLSMAAGWHAHIGLLIDRLESRPPRPFWSEHAEAERHYATLIG